MSRLTRIASVLMVAMLFMMIPSIDANSSGKTGSTNGCGCHSGGGGGIQPSITGLPSQYTPGTTYSISWTGSGTAAGQGGFNLDASAGTWSNLGNRVKTVNGELTHSNDGARSWTADWTAPALGTGDVSFSLAVLYADGVGGNSGDSWGTNQIVVQEGAPPPNTPPTVSNVALTPNGDVTTAQSFTVSYTFFDNDGDQEGPSQIRWFIDGNPAPAHNDAKTITGSSTSIGEVWTVEVTPHDGTELGPIAQCPDSATIVDGDSDNDGTPDGQDAFPNDPSETTDTDDDNDGLSDMDELTKGTDRFDTDSDDDGVMDGTDVFPMDATETIDSDSDGVGDNTDAFPNDGNETLDSDSDGVGNNADAFPNDPDETMDSDGNGVGDNEQKAQEEEDAAQMQLMIIIGVGLILVVVGAVLFMRRKGGDEPAAKEAVSLPSMEPLATSQPLYPTQTSQPVQPVVAEPTVENQWTDEAGHTWRKMSDGSSLWWNGNDWQKV